MSYYFPLFRSKLLIYSEFAKKVDIDFYVFRHILQNFALNRPLSYYKSAHTAIS